MNGSWMIFIPVIAPFLAGFVLSQLRFEERRKREIYCTISVGVNTLLSLLMISLFRGEYVTLVRFTEKLSFSLRIDGFGAVFGTMVALLWFVTTIYAFEYMKHEGRENIFFSFFLMSYGVVMGIAFSANLMTLYIFYEMLTLFTFPLVIHAMGARDRHAGKLYLVYSMLGAALAFMGLIFVHQYGYSLDFTPGGVLNLELIGEKKELLLLIFVMTFFGFGVKAAVFPFWKWLPGASVAPTPVTALLHAVAVVKSGVFAVGRSIYFIFGSSFLAGTWAQDVTMLFAAITIVMGSAMALATPHFKRRLAYSTISNLSYILFAFTLMSPAGFVAGTLHMLAHAVIKITLFFCAGAVLYKTSREFIWQLDGMGRKMPIVFGCFTICSLGLMGVPPLAGFSSKWAIGVAAAACDSPMAIVGTAALIISALLTACYLFAVILRAYFPLNGFDYNSLAKVKDPNWLMTVPLVVLTGASLVLAAGMSPLSQWLATVAAGL